MLLGCHVASSVVQSEFHRSNQNLIYSLWPAIHRKMISTSMAAQCFSLVNVFSFSMAFRLPVDEENVLNSSESLANDVQSLCVSAMAFSDCRSRRRRQSRNNFRDVRRPLQRPVATKWEIFAMDSQHDFVFQATQSMHSAFDLIDSGSGRWICLYLVLGWNLQWSA